MITEIKSMKTQLSLPFLLKTNELDIFIFERDKKGNISFKNDPLRFIAHRTHSYCSDVVNTVESDDKLICRISDVLTQIDTRHICDILKNDLPVQVMHLSRDDNSDFMHNFSFKSIMCEYSFEFLITNYFFIQTEDN